MMPEGISRRMVFLPPIISVWPALWPPWKRTTPWAWSVNQSTILPLPSSPHWVPTTTTFRPWFDALPDMLFSGLVKNVFYPRRGNPLSILALHPQLHHFPLAVLLDEFAIAREFIQIM